MTVKGVLNFPLICTHEISPISVFSQLNRRILIDTGDTGKSEYIKHLNMVLNEEKATIDNIILTHWHHDHIGGVEDILNTLGTDNGK